MAKIKPGPPRGRLLELFSYDFLKGALVRRHVARGRPRRGTKSRNHRIRVDSVLYAEHHLIWLYHTGDWPSDEIDHINGDPKDNRIENLRVVTHVVNMQNQRKAQSNSKTGLLGAFPWRDRFSAQITIDGRIRHLGVFASAEEAHAAYLGAKRISHVGCTI